MRSDAVPFHAEYAELWEWSPLCADMLRVITNEAKQSRDGVLWIASSCLLAMTQCGEKLMPDRFCVFCDFCVK